MDARKLMTHFCSTISDRTLFYFSFSEEIVSIVSLLSADSILVNSTAQREAATNARAKFASSEGDHITLLNIFRAFRTTGKQNKVFLLYL